MWRRAGGGTWLGIPSLTSVGGVGPATKSSHRSGRSEVWQRLSPPMGRSTTRRVRSCTDCTGQAAHARPARVRTDGPDATTIASEVLSVEVGP
jgi:hypothetical protein